MKTVTTVSLGLNLALLGCLVVLCRPQPVHPPVLAAGAASPQVKVDSGPVSSSAPAVPAPFQWRQLCAGDYRGYVNNLRRAGCPEATLRAIVAADVHAVVHRRAEELKKQLTDFAAGSWTRQLDALNQKAAWEAELRQLPDDEAAMIADYLGEKAGTNEMVAAAPVKHRPPAVDEEVIEVPLVAQPVDLSKLNLDASQQQAIADLQKSFLEKVGGPNQNPDDPAYRARWQRAQAEMDDLMRGLLGDQAYQDYQLQVFAQDQARSAAAASSENGE